MKTLKSILKIYGINEILIKNDKRVEIIILNRNQNITLNRWINMINAIKYTYKKEVDFLLQNDAVKIYGDLNIFELVKVNEYE